VISFAKEQNMKLVVVIVALMALTIRADTDPDNMVVWSKNRTFEGDDSVFAKLFEIESNSEELAKLFERADAPFEVQACSGTCQNTANSCSTGYISGLCPGASNIKCCPSSGSSSSFGDGSSANRQALYNAAMALYNQRANEHYTQGSSRWSGITGRVRPPNAPPYSDCSSSTTWMYWTVFGNGPDFLNNQRWAAGYTGSMSPRGRSIPCSSMQTGDLAFYGKPTISHVAMSIGGGRVVSHGSDPVGLYSYNYRSDLNQCRTYLQ
jgi:cell wall-associated NlpC family hydrolase